MASLDDRLQEQVEQNPQDVGEQEEVEPEEIEEEQRRQEAIESYRQQQRIDAQNSRTNQLKELAKDQAKKQAKKAILKVLWATAPYWGPVLGVILIVAIVIGLVVIIPPVLCNSDGWDGTLARFSSTLAAKAGLSYDFCSVFKVAVNPGSGGGGASGSFAGLDIVLTSAYRAGAIVAGTNKLSGHARGEAVDIALRNATGNSDPRIAQLVQIAKSAGFVPLVGDTLDEYNNPTEGATGGHVHVEFNLKADGATTYCDNTISKNPPTDLVSIPSTIPTQGVSDPRLRPCMLNQVLAIFAAAANATSPTPTPTPVGP